MWNIYERLTARHWFVLRAHGCGHVAVADRDGFRERGALGHLSFWGPTQVWPVWPFVWKAWKYALSKLYLWLCSLWFYDCLRSSTEIKAIPTIFWRTTGNAIFSWNW